MLWPGAPQQSKPSRLGRGLVSAVMQTGGLLKDLTVRETVAYTARLFARSQPVDHVLATAGISEIAGRKVGTCSGGEQQRLPFAMALLPDPALLLLDEPTTGMDVEGRRAFWAAIRADAQRGDTVLVHARDTDAVARHLLTQTPARDLEITASGLEEAFLSLTGTEEA